MCALEVEEKHLHNPGSVTELTLPRFSSRNRGQESSKECRFRSVQLAVGIGMGKQEPTLCAAHGIWDGGSERQGKAPASGVPEQPEIQPCCGCYRTRMVKSQRGSVRRRGPSSATAAGTDGTAVSTARRSSSVLQTQPVGALPGTGNARRSQRRDFTGSTKRGEPLTAPQRSWNGRKPRAALPDAVPRFADRSAPRGSTRGRGTPWTRFPAPLLGEDETPKGNPRLSCTSTCGGEQRRSREPAGESLHICMCNSSVMCVLTTHTEFSCFGARPRRGGAAHSSAFAKSQRRSGPACSRCTVRGRAGRLEVRQREGRKEGSVGAAAGEAVTPGVTPSNGIAVRGSGSAPRGHRTPHGALVGGVPRPAASHWLRRLPLRPHANPAAPIGYKRERPRPIPAPSGCRDPAAPGGRRCPRPPRRVPRPADPRPSAPRPHHPHPCTPRPLPRSPARRCGRWDGEERRGAEPGGASPAGRRASPQ